MIQKKKLVQFYLEQYEQAGKKRPKRSISTAEMQKRVQTLFRTLRSAKPGRVNVRLLEDYHRQLKNISVYAHRKNRADILKKLQEEVLPKLVSLDLGILLEEQKEGMDETFLSWLQENYPGLYMVSSTTKVITDFDLFSAELDRDEFRYVVPDFRLNKAFDRLGALSQKQKDKVEFLCNECCWFSCQDRKACYEDVSRMALGEKSIHRCTSPNAAGGYRFSKAMENPGFIGIDDIKNIYLPLGFSNFKIEGRSLGSAIVLEFLLYYMTKPEYQLRVREEIYLDNTLDLF